MWFSMVLLIGLVGCAPNRQIEDQGDTSAHIPFGPVPTYPGDSVYHIDGVPVVAVLPPVSDTADPRLIGAVLTTGLQLGFDWVRTVIKYRVYCVGLRSATGLRAPAASVLNYVTIPKGLSLGVLPDCDGVNVTVSGVKLDGPGTARATMGVSCGPLCGADWICEFRSRSDRWSVHACRIVGMS
ncbi:MAG TPA: hypothetical protein VFL95_00160 [Gemmatimonadales bacterium]|nr:hypothetical protein [Gemmatimonadales bacterium]